jgi:Transposase, Mutator family
MLDGVCSPARPAPARCAGRFSLLWDCVRMARRKSSTSAWRRVKALPNGRSFSPIFTAAGSPAMICVDGGSGLLAALPSVLHGIPVQRCWAHKFRNVLDKVRKPDQPKVKRALHKIMNAAIRRKRPTAAMPCLPRDRKEIWTDLRWAVAGVSVGPEQSPGVSAGGFSFGAARSGLPVSLQLDCPPPLRNALSFVSALRPRCFGRWGSEFEFPRKPVDYPPVTLIWRAIAGRRWRRSMMKSWPLGFRPIASSMAA